MKSFSANRSISSLIEIPSFFSIPSSDKCTVEINDAKGKKKNTVCSRTAGNLNVNSSCVACCHGSRKGICIPRRKARMEARGCFCWETCYTLGTISSISVTAITVLNGFRSASRPPLEIKIRWNKNLMESGEISRRTYLVSCTVQSSLKAFHLKIENGPRYPANASTYKRNNIIKLSKIRVSFFF